MEPTSAESVAQWIQTAQRQRDSFEHLRLASHEHRESHGAGCSVYPTSSGPLLSVLAAAVAAERILEVGCGLGYSALCMAHGSGGVVKTIERDTEHARLAEQTILREGYGDRNLFLAQFVHDLPNVDHMAEYRQRLLDDDRLLTTIVPGGLAISVLRPDRDEVK